MRKKKLLPTWITLLLVLAFIAYRNGWFSGNAGNNQQQSNEISLDRDPSQLIYTFHAKCRMDCRMIDSSEVADILVNGKINTEKSDLADSKNLKYALEGKSDDHQKIRIIVAPESNGLVVVTVIDLEKDWKCDC